MKKCSLLLLLPALALGIYDMRQFYLGHWMCWFSNFGTWGYADRNPGGEWPSGTGDMYIYGAGMWLGALAGDDTLVTFGYNTNSGGSEMFPTLCRHWREGSGNPDDRIYAHPGDWPPPRSRFPMAPVNPESDAELWCCFSDSNPQRHMATGRPLGVDAALTVHSFADSGARDFFFLKWQIFNSSNSMIEHAYFGIVMDADLGNAANDRCGLILNRLFLVRGETLRVKDVGYCFSEDNSPSGAIAVMLLAAPDGLGLSAFKLFTLNDVDPSNDFEQYLALAGYDYGRPGHPYNPYDSIDPACSDKRFLLSSGPLDIRPEETVTFWFAVIGAQYDPADTSELAERCYWAERLWRERLIGIEEEQPTPYAQRLTLSASPNPFRSSTTVRFSSRLSVPSSLDIFDTQGRIVRTLSADRSFSWDGRNNAGRLVPGGIYFVKVNTGLSTETAKVVFVRD